MNTPPLQQQIDALDRAYYFLTGRERHGHGIMTGRETWWQQFIKAGFTEADLTETISWIKAKIRAGKRFEASLNFRRLIADLATFEDELSVARAEKRNAKQPFTPKERVLSQARPVALPECPVANDSATHVSVYIKALRDAVNQTP